MSATRDCQIVHAPGDDHVDGEAGLQAIDSRQLALFDAAAAFDDGLEHLDACAARIPADTLMSVGNGVHRDGGHQHPINGRDPFRSITLPGPYGPQGKIRHGRKSKPSKAHAHPCGACGLRALERNRERDIAGLGRVLQVGPYMRLVVLGADEQIALLLQGFIQDGEEVAVTLSDGDDAGVGTAMLSLADRRPLSSCVSAEIAVSVLPRVVAARVPSGRPSALNARVVCSITPCPSSASVPIGPMPCRARWVV